MSIYKDLTRDRMRQIMGSFCSGVTVITAETPDGPTGFTCQSFTSLSMEPPLIAFNPMKTSTSWPKIRALGTFCVNILSTESEQVSGQFARSGADKFAGVTYSASPSGNPILNCALAWVECRLHAEYDGGDHTIVVGHIDSMHAREDVDPLLFYRGRYASLEKAAVSIG
jgi:3-hydroxy-9,10-secoandrosta-1,3,5(10)-triene-9,17-dione monooxygenase reductase component